MSESAFGGPPPPLAAARMLLRPAAIEDVPALVEVQEIAAIAGLAHIFPQDEYPFPREAIKRDWVAEIGRPGVDVFVVSRRPGRIEGFAALRTDELLHFGTALDTWGSGLAGEVHAELVSLWTAAGHTSAWLRVFDENHRARRFYEKMGWRPTSATSRGEYPPYPPLTHYEIRLPAGASPRP
jgi:RimJ/RimL family protein N-acetyltransferase